MSFDHPALILLHLAGFAFFVSLAISGLVVFCGPADRPGPRSAHVEVVPRSGGLGVIAGLGAGLLALALYYPNFGAQNALAALVALFFGVGFLGFSDDLLGLGARFKFLLILLLAIALVGTIGPPTNFPTLMGALPIPWILGFVGAVLWVFVMTNAVNFMDGANGLMALTMAVAFLGLALIGYFAHASLTMILSVLMLAALLGFLPYNLKTKAQVFAGDVGSLVVGFVYAGAGLLLVRETDGAGFLYVGPLLVLPLLADVFLTLLLRAIMGENLLTAHCQHLYQRLIFSGRSHLFVTWLYGMASLLVLAVSLVAVRFHLVQSVLFLALCISVFSLAYMVLYKQISRSN